MASYVRHALLYRIRQASPVQFVSFRVRIVVSVPKVEFAPSAKRRGDPKQALKGARPVFFKEAGGFVQTPVYDRSLLTAGGSFLGPAVVEEPDSTTIIPPSYRALVEPFMSLVITRA